MTQFSFIHATDLPIESSYQGISSIDGRMGETLKRKTRKNKYPFEK